MTHYTDAPPSHSDRRCRMKPTRDEIDRAMALSDELYKSGGAAEDALRAKCRWEHMSRPAVILEWGDPRDWPAPTGEPIEPENPELVDRMFAKLRASR